MTTWQRPRGVRRIPPARLRAARDPYGALHRRIRAALLAQLAAAGGWPCPLCGQMMYAWMGRSLHLHHSDPAAKLRGEPGNQLTHGACNLRSGGQDGAAITNGTTAAGRGTVTPIKTVTARKPSRASRDW